MEFKLSDHAQKRIQQRRILPEWIKAAIEHPDLLEDDFEDSTLGKRRFIHSIRHCERSVAIQLFDIKRTSGLPRRYPPRFARG
ncbi:MAG: DUF4258 domain-containing protein [Gallionella sp.]|nr:DUF4258 domain-containing protein [Gallionella sp.]